MELNKKKRNPTLKIELHTIKINMNFERKSGKMTKTMQWDDDEEDKEDYQLIKIVNVLCSMGCKNSVALAILFIYEYTCILFCLLLVCGCVCAFVGMHDLVDKQENQSIKN